MLLEAKNVTVAYDTAVVLDGISLGVHIGELLSIVGPNGAGKTTLLRTLCGLMSWEKEMKRGMRKEVSNISSKARSSLMGSRSIPCPLIGEQKKG